MPLITKQQSRIISSVLSPACRVWLRSQVSAIGDMSVKISGGDRQILSGYIPKVAISASRAIYQGLHLSQVHLVGENIRINLGQVLKGKPLRLLEPIPVSGELLLEEADLKASLDAPLLATALTDLLGTLLLAAFHMHPADILEDQQINWQQITIEPECLTLSGTLTDATNYTKPFVLRTDLQLASPHELLLVNPCIEIQQKLVQAEEGFKIDLGKEVDIQELTLSQGRLVCRGGITVIP